MDNRTSVNAIIFGKKVFIMKDEAIHYIRRVNLRKLRVLLLQKMNDNSRNF